MNASAPSVSPASIKRNLTAITVNLIEAHDFNVAVRFDAEVSFGNDRRFRVEFTELVAPEPAPIDRPRDSLVDGLEKLGISAGDVESFDRCGDIVYIDCKDGRSFMFDMTGV